MPPLLKIPYNLCLALEGMPYLIVIDFTLGTKRVFSIIICVTELMFERDL